MSFNLLPAELQIEVFSYLANFDLKAVRAVSRKLHDNASPALFRSVVACARYEALGAFQKISLHSVLQTYVKEIVFDGSVYNRDLAYSSELYQTYNSKLHDHRASSSFWSIRARWKRYKDLYTEQEDLKSSGVLLQTIARALEWTTNVSSIVYSPHPHLIPVEAVVVRDLVPRHFGPGHPLFPDMHPGHGQNQFRTRLEHPFRQLIGAVYLAQYTGIRELRVEACREKKSGTPFAFHFFDCPDTTDLRAGRHLFQHLERCELNITVGSAHDDASFWPPNDLGKKRLAHVNYLLAAADNLRHLTFQIFFGQPIGNSAAEQPLFSRLGLLKTWPQLRSLSLGGIHANEEDFLGLIRRHKNTLRTLSFRDCSLFSGAWVDIVDEVVYSTGIVPFVLDSVNEASVPTGDGTAASTTGLEQWRYEGHIEVSRDGERNFVNLNPRKMSVYHLRNSDTYQLSL